MRSFLSLLTLFLIFSVFSTEVEGVVPNTPGFSISDVQNYTLLSTSNLSKLYSVSLQQDDYQYPIYLIDLWGTRTQMGFDYGYLLAHQIQKNYNSAINAILKETGVGFVLEQVIQVILQDFLDWQWEMYLSKEVPSEYMEELQGIEQGGEAAGLNSTLTYVTRCIVLANLPSDLIDLKYILLEEYQQWKDNYALLLSSSSPSSSSSSSSDLTDDQALLRFERNQRLTKSILSSPKGLQCSMFAVWGDRTQSGDLFSARNLDYMPDMGIDKYKLITIWHPNDGKYEHLSIGYSGMYGALTGVSSMGVSVHEANLEVNEETFSGFPWLLRLRYIMENTLHLSDAWELWEKTNNTVGYNHMVTSAYDAKLYNTYAALVMETMAGYTAYFMDNDPREKFATFYDPFMNQSIPIGFPLPNALWRTNHGYDPTIREHYMWAGMHAGNWSMERYMFAYEGFTFYQNENTLIGSIEAINITSILGDKGEHAYVCEDNTDGTNIISVTYHPIAQQLYAAWENGSGSSWRPAACNTYAHFDLTQWFTTSPPN